MEKCRICSESAGILIEITANYFICEGCMTLVKEKIDQNEVKK